MKANNKTKAGAGRFRRAIRRQIAGLALVGLTAFSAHAATQQYFGLYRGDVVNNVDPMNLGRLQVVVPAVTGTQPMGWALPVLQYPYSAVSLKLPQIGQTVWIEYERGDPRYPVWVGVMPR